MLARVALVAAAGLVLASGAYATRSPTLQERTAITRSLPAFLRNEPAGCVWLNVRLSNNRSWAMVEPQYLIESGGKADGCLRYAANGFWLLKKSAGWKTVWNGSDGPSCSLGVPPDLVPCRR